MTPKRSARQLDIFGTANFFNHVPFTAALELVLEIGVERVAGHIDELVRHLLARIDRSRYRLVSADDVRSSLVLVEPLEEPAGEVYERLCTAGVYAAHRRGRIRFSPHLYNTPDDIDAALALL